MMFGIAARVVGMVVIIGAFIGYLLADMPLVEAVFGSTIGAQLDYAKSSIGWSVPLGVMLYFIPEQGPYRSFLLGLGSFVTIYLFTHPEIFGGFA